MHFTNTASNTNTFSTRLFYYYISFNQNAPTQEDNYAVAKEAVITVNKRKKTLSKTVTFHCVQIGF